MMVFFYLAMAFFVIGILALLGIAIFGIIMFFTILVKKKPQNILKVLKMPGTFILLALLLICLIIPILVKEFVENNVVLFYFVIGIPTIFISKSLSHGLKNYKKDLFTWISAILFGFASLALCVLLFHLLNRFFTGESEGFRSLKGLFISTIIGVISIFLNIIEIMKINSKDKFAGANKESDSVK
jgi:hypothetical protein